MFVATAKKPRAGAGGIDRRMFKQPDQFPRFASGNRLVAARHLVERGAIIDRFALDAAFNLGAVLHLALRGDIGCAYQGGASLQAGEAMT